MVVPATAENSVSASKVAHKSTAPGKKVAPKHTPSHATKGKVQSGEAASLEKETGSADQHGAREENRGRLTASEHAASHGSRTAKPPKGDKHTHVASTHTKSATLQNANQSHKKAGLKTSQLTNGKAARAQTKNVSMQHEAAGKSKKSKTKMESADPAKDDASKPSHSPAMKPINARMF